jgi:hypothetical protein
MAAYNEVTESFHTLLDWHLVDNGTRPPGDKFPFGTRWGDEEFGEAVGRDISRKFTGKAVSQWRKGAYAPRIKLIDHILRALFGYNPTGAHAAWREDLRKAYEVAKRGKSESAPRTVEDQEPAAGSAYSTTNAKSIGQDSNDYSKELQSIIYALEHHHTNPEGIFWIGQTLVQCRSFLKRREASGSALSLVESLLDDIDADERSKEGVFDVWISSRKIARLIDELLVLQSPTTLSPDQNTNTNTKAVVSDDERRDYIQELDHKVLQFSEIEIKLSDTWNELVRWLRDRVSPGELVAIEPGSNEPDFYASGSPGRLRWPVSIVFRRGGLAMRMNIDLVSDWLHPRAVEGSPKGTLPWDTSLFPTDDSQRLTYSGDDRGLPDAMYRLLLVAEPESAR